MLSRSNGSGISDPFVASLLLEALVVEEQRGKRANIPGVQCTERRYALRSICVRRISHWKKKTPGSPRGGGGNAGTLLLEPRRRLGVDRSLEFLVLPDEEHILRYVPEDDDSA